MLNMSPSVPTWSCSPQPKTVFAELDFTTTCKGHYKQKQVEARSKNDVWPTKMRSWFAQRSFRIGRYDPPAPCDVAFRMPPAAPCARRTCTFGGSPKTSWDDVDTYGSPRQAATAPAALAGHDRKSLFNAPPTICMEAHLNCPITLRLAKFVSGENPTRDRIIPLKGIKRSVCIGERFKSELSQSKASEDSGLTPSKSIIHTEGLPDFCGPNAKQTECTSKNDRVGRNMLVLHSYHMQIGKVVSVSGVGQQEQATTAARQGATKFRPAGTDLKKKRAVCALREGAKHGHTCL